MTTEQTSRRYDIDALRSIALMLLIIYHIFICYRPGAERIGFLTYPQHLTELSFIFDALNIWRIPILFLISGIALGFLAKRRTTGEILRDRILRLTPPFVFCWFFISPAFPALFAYYHQQPVTYKADSALHLWFVQNLVAYTILIFPLVAFIKKRPNNLLIRFTRTLMPWGMPVLFAIPLIIETHLTFAADYFVTWYARFGAGLICYTAGFIFISTGPVFWTSARKLSRISLALALVLYLGRIFYIDRELGIREWTHPIETTLWMLAVLGYGVRFLNRPSKLFRYLNPAVFPIYILHMPLQQLVAVYIYPCDLAPLLTFTLHCLFTFALCLMGYEFIIRRIPWLHGVMGLKLAGAVNQPPPLPLRGIRKFGRGVTLYLLSPLVFFSSISFGAMITIGMIVERGGGDSHKDWRINPTHAALPDQPTTFNNHSYLVFNSEKEISWDEAQSLCEEMGGYLVTINDAAENDFLTTIGAGNGFYHLGATDRENEGTWIWSDGSEMEYQNWGDGEPNNHGGNEEYLVALYSVWPKWIDYKETAFGFICEWKTDPDPEVIERVRKKLNSNGE